MKIEFTPNGGAGDLNCIVDGKVRFSCFKRAEGGWAVHDIEKGGAPKRSNRDEEALKNVLAAILIGGTERAVEYAGRDDLHFAEWLSEVDQKCIRKTMGFSVFDLTDQPFRVWFDEGLPPEAALSMTLADVGMTGEEG
jgi:hypothetical protein